MPQTFQFGPLHHLESIGAFVAVAFFVKVFIWYTLIELTDFIKDDALKTFFYIEGRIASTYIYKIR